jgi:hypothetical protein
VTKVVTIRLDRADAVMALGMPEAPLVCLASDEGRVLLLDAPALSRCPSLAMLGAMLSGRLDG